MRLLHLDPFAGVSGDMFLGALAGAGVPLAVMAEAVERVVPGEAALSARPVVRAGLAGTQVEVELVRERRRTLAEMRAAVEGAGLDPAVRELALAALARIGEAETRVHGSAGEPHLHEMGSTDTLVDVLGTAAGIAHLAPARITSAPVNVGSGAVRIAHGEAPVPAPATAELLRGAPVFSRGPAFELTTPTGAALLVTLLARFPGGFSPLPPMTLEGVGLGAGSSEFPGFANLFRIFVGDEPAFVPPKGGTTAGSAPDGAEEAVVIEVGLDDVSPEYLAPLAESLHGGGAREVMLIPALGKKGRMGVLLRVLAPVELQESLVAQVLEQTGSPGARFYKVGRVTLPRETVTVDTPWGPVRVKWWLTPAGRRRGKPEFDDCAAAARAAGVSPAEVREAAMAAFLKTMS
jgi:pyridinium-3,5-bisthiocarboxylic acid mononucleotide nickel chelatase